MTLDMFWSKIEIDLVEPFYMFDIYSDEELLKCFNWKNTQPLLKEIRKQKGI